MGFNFFQISAQNQNGLAFGFTQKHRFATKTNRNNEFLRRKAQNLDRLRIMLMYIRFYVFKKNQISAQNSKGLAFGFTKNVSLGQNLTETPYLIAIKSKF
jgi:hypothetical protein